jgi:histidinol-phosphate/aromatic aminotransferase/cobyric acid decarboxylase-like protein
MLKANPDSVIVVDEAYVDFGGESAIKLVDGYDNLLVIHTLSKSRSLAGMRVGFAVGHPGLIEALERVKNSFNSYPLDRLAIVGAVAAMEDTGYFTECCNAVIATREQLSAELSSLGFEVLPSAANFIFTRHPQHDAAKLAAALRERGIIVRQGAAREPRRTPPDGTGRLRGCIADGMRGSSGTGRVSGSDYPAGKSVQQGVASYGVQAKTAKIKPSPVSQPIHRPR